MRKVRFLIFILCTVLFTFISFSKVLAVDEMVTIQFEDEYFYRALIDFFSNPESENNSDNEVESDLEFETHDETLQIIMKREDVLNVIDIDVSEYNITNLSGIEHFVNLESFVNINDWNATRKINNLSYFEGLEKLKEIRLDYNNISDLTPIRKLKNLEILDLCYNPLSEDISIIESLTNVQELWLVGTGRKNLPDLTKLPNLKLLYIDNNYLDDISVIEELNNLEMVSFENQSIRKVIPQNGIQSIDLPPIFLSMKDRNSKIYTESEYELINCTLSEDGKKILMNTDNLSTAQVKIGKEEGTGSTLTQGDVTLNIVVDTSLPSEENQEKNESEELQQEKSIDKSKSVLEDIRTDNTQANKILPKTGYIKHIIVFIVVCSLISIILYSKYKNIDR